LQNQLETEVLIVGAGSTGLSLARELSRYKTDITVVDRNVEVCFGEVRSSHGLIYSSVGLSWANSLILKSLMSPDLSPSELFHRNSLKTRLTQEGFDSFPALAKELDVTFKKSRRVIVGKDEEDFKALDILQEIYRSMDIEPESLDQEGILELEPAMSREYTRGFTQVGDVAYIDPWEYGIALAENAKANGVSIMLLSEVLGITPRDGGFLVATAKGTIKTRFIVNAAGPYSDKIAEMAGLCDFGLKYTRSQMLIADRRMGARVNYTCGLAPRPGGSASVRPTLNGNLHIGASGYRPASGPEDTGTKAEWTDLSIQRARELFPDIRKEDVIASYVGVRVFNTRDPENHLIEVSSKNPNFINAVIRLPGLTPSPAIAKYVVELLGNQGLELARKADFNPRRKRIPKASELPEKERSQLIARDPRYGRMVCRCEQVSEGEIIEAIKRGARTVAGVKYRTRAGMGRCQQDYCGTQIVEILASELGISKSRVLFKGAGSELVYWDVNDRRPTRN